MDRVEQGAPRPEWVGLIQSVEGLPSSRRLAVPQVRGSLSCLAACDWDCDFSSPSNLN